MSFNDLLGDDAEHRDPYPVEEEEEEEEKEVYVE
jgi:hypothetical protein